MSYLGIGPASFTNNLTNVQILDDISSGFNGNTATFNLTANSVPFQAVSDRALMVILGGVIQAPGVDYTINGSQITFTTNPLSGLTFYARNIYGLNALNGVNDGIVGPYSLTTGGPSWDTSGNITISGNLTVQGSTTTIQSTTLDVIDKDIKLASNQSTNAGIDTAGLLWGTTAVKLKYYNNGGTNPGLNIEGTNVGIGVTAPTVKLDVAGVTKITKGTSGGATANTDAALILDNSSHTYLQFRTPSDKEQGILFGDVQDNNVGSIAYSHSTNALSFATGANPRLTIDSSGRVQIGASNNTGANTKLVVGAGNNINTTAIINTGDVDVDALWLSNWDGSTTTNKVMMHFDSSGIGGFNVGMPAATDAFVIEDAGTAERLRIDSSGRILIGGRTSGSFAIDLQTGSDSTFRMRNSGETGHGSHDAKIVAGGSYYQNPNIVGSTIKFSTYNGSSEGERARITSGGSLIVGNQTSTSYKLCVSEAAHTRVEVISTSNASAGTWFKVYNGGTLTSQSTIRTSGGSLQFYTGTTSEAERISIDSSGHVTPAAVGTQDLGSTSKEFRNLYLGDDGSVYCGSDQDIRIFHSSGTNYFTSPTNKQLQLKGDGGLLIRGGGNQNIAQFKQADGCDLYHNQTLTLETTSSGISVTGEVAATQDYPNIRPILDFNFVAVKKLDPRFTFVRSSAASYIDEYGYLKFVGENEPRFDHDPNTGECLGLMIEQATSNLFANTGGTGAPGEEPFAGANLGNSPTQSLVENIVLPTGGTGTVRRVQFHASGNSGLRFGWTSGGSANNPYSASLWARTVSGSSDVTIDVNDHDNNTYTLTPEWTRMKSTGTTNQAYRFMDLMCGDGGDIYIWGYQIEQSDHVTSYIPSYANTIGTQTAASRELDWVGITGDEHSDIWNSTEGTYVINYKPNEPAVGDGVIIGSRRGTQGSGYPWPLYRHDTANTNNFKSYDLDNGVISISTTWADQIESWALGFNGTNGSIARNGSLVQTNNTNMRGLINADELWLGSNGVGSNQYSMYVKRLMYYAKKVSNTQLVTLTS